MENKVKGKVFLEERALFKSNNLEVEECSFDIGESPLKESNNIKVSRSTFSYKYPLWYCNNVYINNTLFNEMARSGIWYSKDISLDNVISNAPKTFRRCEQINIANTTFADGEEMLWNCDKVQISHSKLNGDYILMNSSNIVISNTTIKGNYTFDGSKNIVVRNCILESKDCFWNCENVEVYDSTIIGEYIGWNSKNLKFINCKIESHQGFCYCDNLVIKNTFITKSDLIFEFCKDLDVDCYGNITSILNPLSGKIVFENCEEVIVNIKSTAEIIKR